MRKFLVIFILILFTSSCSSVPKVKELNPTSKPALTPNTGVAFGKMQSVGASFGTAIRFKKLNSNEEQQLNGAKDFVIELAEGEYSLSSFGGRAREIKPLGSSKGVVFSVKTGQATYVGNLVLGALKEGQACNSNMIAKKENKLIKAYPHVGFNRGTLAMGEIQEVDWDQRCLLQFDNFSEDFQKSNLSNMGFSAKQIKKP